MSHFENLSNKICLLENLEFAALKWEGHAPLSTPYAPWLRPMATPLLIPSLLACYLLKPKDRILHLLFGLLL